MEKSDGGKSKAQLKAERRAKQEADRAAKAAAKAGNQPVKPANKEKSGSSERKKEPKPVQKPPKEPNNLPENLPKPNPPPSAVDEVEAVQNSLQDMTVAAPSTAPRPASPPRVHPSFVDFGLQCSEKILLGTDSRCVGLACAFKEFIKDYKRPKDKAFGRDIETAIRPHITYLSGGSPLPAALGNLVKLLKHEMTSLPDDISEELGREKLCEWLDLFIQLRISLAYETISLYTRQKMGEVEGVLTFGFCPLVEKTLRDAKKAGMDFRVLVLDTFPEQEGKIMLQNLTKAGFQCSYSMITALAYMIRDCSIVLLGCDAVLANGSLVCRLGANQVVLVARAHNVPVLALCPTYKFSEKVQTTSASASGSRAGGQQHAAGTALASGETEVVSADFVTGLVTELRTLPPSSAPAVLRVKQVL